MKVLRIFRNKESGDFIELCKERDIYIIRINAETVYTFQNTDKEILKMHKTLQKLV